MNDSVIIRSAQVDDALGIAEVLHAQQVFSALLMPTPVETAERTAERLRVCNPQSESLYVAIHKQQVVGYGALRWWNSLILPGPDAYLSELFVLPDYRSQGIGSALLLRLRQDAVARGSTRLWCINLRNRDSYLRGYYKKSGWEEKDIAVFFDTLDH